MKYLRRTLCLLLFLVMVTSPSAGRTYAEYAKEASGSDETRISKFGVDVTCTSSAFAVSYGTTVKSSAKVVAPGTNGNFVAYTITGAPEVRVKVTKTATITMNGYWTNSGTGTSGTFYCPLTFTVGSTTINGLNYSSKDALIAALKTELEKGSGDYAAGTDLASKANLNRTVTWSWPFENATGSAINQTMANDTALGNKSTKPTISISMDVMVEQVD